MFARNKLQILLAWISRPPHSATLAPLLAHDLYENMLRKAPIYYIRGEVFLNGFVQTSKRNEDRTCEISNGRDQGIHIPMPYLKSYSMSLLPSRARISVFSSAF